MLLRILSKNQFINSLFLLIFIIILLLVKSVGFGESYIESFGYFGETLEGLHLDFPILSDVLVVLMLFFQSTYINRMVIINKLNTNITLIPGFLFILFVFITIQDIYLNSILIASFFLTIAITYLNYSFKLRNSSTNVFNAGFWLGMSVIFYPVILIYIICFFIGFNILRKFRINEIYQFLVGVSIPIFLLGVFAFLNNDLHAYLESQFSSGFSFLNIGNGLETQDIFIIVMFISLAIISVFSFVSYTAKKPIPSQNMLSIQYWFMLFSGISLLFTSVINENHFALLCIPLSIFISESITIMKNKLIAELTLWFLIILSVILQFQLLN